MNRNHRSRLSSLHILCTFFILAILVVPFDGLIKVFAQEGGEVIHIITVGENPFGVAYNPENGNM